jgi:hypothetical protein
MAQVALVDAAVDAGERLIEALASTPFDPESALWLYRPETDDWVLLLGSSAIRSAGSRAAYSTVQSLLRSDDFEPLKLDDISLADNDDQLLRLLRVAVQTGPHLSRIRFSRNRIGNAFVEDALIHRLQDSRVGQPT